MPEAAARFQLGRLSATAKAINKLDSDDMFYALNQHRAGNWGDVDARIRSDNERALLEGTRLLSIHHTPDGVEFWIITEMGRDTTTVLLPEDY